MLLDTLVVRTVLVPALALILGERFWWPRRVTGRASGSGATSEEAASAAVRPDAQEQASPR